MSIFVRGVPTEHLPRLLCSLEGLNQEIIKKSNYCHPPVFGTSKFVCIPEYITVCWKANQTGLVSMLIQ